MARNVLGIVPFFLLVNVLAAQGEDPKRKPVLIRADQTQQEVEKEAVVKPDPNVAREHVKIGDFYFRRDNYKAAEHRYRDAIRYHPKWSEPYEKLVRVLERMKAYQEALEVCELFQETNPDSTEKTDFQELSLRLRAQLSDQPE